jgi:glutathione S-transferase
MLTLYQFPISHYCEKVRWALDYKGLEYTTKNLLPGIHLVVVKKLARRSSVPVLVDNKTVIQDSTDIINYLDRHYPDRPLTPSDTSMEKEITEWERYVDKEVGVHLRRYFYSILLDHPKVVIPFFTHNGPWYGRPFMQLAFPALRKKMLTSMDISKQTAMVSLNHLDQAINRLADHMRDREFMVGNSFSRADLAAASLLAPLCSPAGYGLDWPDSFPEGIEKVMARYKDKVSWVSDLYRNYR